jgi:hypothetical protein
VEPTNLDAFGATVATEARRHSPLILAIDEAQHLEPTTLAGLSDLVDAAAAPGARFSMILAGHVELAGKLAAISAIRDRPGPFTEIRLSSLPPTEIWPYIEHRLRHAGCQHPGVFPADAIAVVAARTEGVPRLVNQLCAAALRLAREADRTTVSAALVVQAARRLPFDPVGGVVDREPLAQPEGRRSRVRSRRVDRRRVRGRSARRRANWSEVSFVFVAFGLLAYVSHPRLTEVVVGGSGAAQESVTPAEPTHPEAAVTTLGPSEPMGPDPKATATRPSESHAIDPLAPAPAATRSQEQAASAPTTPGTRAGRTTVERPRARGLSADERRLLDGAEDGDLGQVTALLTRGVSRDPRDRHGLTPLMLAIIQGHGGVAQALLTHGASARVRDRGGLTPLMFAAINDRFDLLLSLLAHGVAVDARSVAGWTALTYAAWQGHSSIARRLLRAGADPGATDRRGWTAARYAAWRAIEGERSAPDEDDQGARGHTAVLALLDEADRLRQPETGTAVDSQRTKRRAARP